MNTETQQTPQSEAQAHGHAPISPASPVASNQQSPSTLLSLLADLAVNAVVSAVVALLVIKFGAPLVNTDQEKSNSNGFVVVNFEVLAREQILAMGEKVRAGTMDANDMTARSNRFTQEAIDRVKAYTAEGKVVLRADAVFAAPDGVEDVTDSLRDALVKSGAMEKSVSRTPSDK